MKSDNRTSCLWWNTIVFAHHTLPLNKSNISGGATKSHEPLSAFEQLLQLSLGYPSKHDWLHGAFWPTSGSKPNCRRKGTFDTSLTKWHIAMNLDTIPAIISLREGCHGIASSNLLLSLFTVNYFFASFFPSVFIIGSSMIRMTSSRGSVNVFILPDAARPSGLWRS